MIDAMNKDSYLLLVVGFLLGFLVMYLWVRDRDLGPIVVRGIPVTAPGVSPGNAALIAELEDDVANDPGNFQSLVELGNLNFDSENFSGAADYYARALNVQPDNANVRTDLGTALYYSNQVDAAVSEFEKSLEIDPDHPQTLFNMGVILLEERNDRAGAIQVWEHLVDVNPGYSQVGMVREEIARLKGQQP
jgi:cytochrome c-type biogenesis protein CcmH/NrfG